jgi:hypothetical protein
VLCESVERRGEDVLLILDDLDQLEDDDASVHLLRALCLQAPAQLHLALSGRRVPALGLGASAGAGEVLEISAPTSAYRVLKARGGVIQEVGTASKALLQTRAARARFAKAFVAV